MTTPAYFNTAARAIDYAMEDAGLLPEGATPNSEQYAKGLNKLNDIINLEQTQGLKLFLLQDVTIPLIQGQGTYVLSPTGDVVMTKPMRAIDAYYSDQNGIRRPLIPLSWNDKVRLSQINQQGALNSYFVDKQATYLSVFFWLLPDATAVLGTAHLILQVQAPNVVQITDTTAFPQEWFIFLRWALADELATGQPQAIMDRCQQRAERYRRMLEDWDVEDAPTMFQPDSRMTYHSGGFR